MTFSEKLFKLRKEQHLSQEALAEKLGTTRQAVSKWETGNGFPETEKLLIMSNIFGVTVDYLLKDIDVSNRQDENGYYVSREFAEGFIINQKRCSRQYALGFGILILSAIPYLLFNEFTPLCLFITIAIVVLGIGIILLAGFNDDEQYNILKREPLILDGQFLKEIKLEYKSYQRKSSTAIIVSICTLIAGAMPFLLVKRDFISTAVVEPYYPICVLLIALSIYLLVRLATVLDGYSLIAENEKYSNSLGFKISKKIKKRFD